MASNYVPPCGSPCPPTPYGSSHFTPSLFSTPCPSSRTPRPLCIPCSPCPCSPCSPYAPCSPCTSTCPRRSPSPQAFSPTEERILQASPPGNTTFTLPPPGNTTFTLPPTGNTTFTLSPPGNTTFTLSPHGNATFTLPPPQNTTFTLPPPENTTFTLPPVETTFLVPHTPFQAPARRIQAQTKVLSAHTPVQPQYYYRRRVTPKPTPPELMSFSAPESPFILTSPERLPGETPGPFLLPDLTPLPPNMWVYTDEGSYIDYLRKQSDTTKLVPSCPDRPLSTSLPLPPRSPASPPFFSYTISQAPYESESPRALTSSPAGPSIPPLQFRTPAMVQQQQLSSTFLEGSPAFLADTSVSPIGSIPSPSFLTRSPNAFQISSLNISPDEDSSYVSGVSSSPARIPTPYPRRLFN